MARADCRLRASRRGYVCLSPRGSWNLKITNYPDRAGWKEIVITAEKGASIEQATQGDRTAARC